jgi:hypothetical protein
MEKRLKPMSESEQNRLSPKQVALVKRDPQNLNWFQGLAADFRPRFLTLTQNRCG